MILCPRLRQQPVQVGTCRSARLGLAGQHPQSGDRHARAARLAEPAAPRARGRRQRRRRGAARARRSAARALAARSRMADRAARKPAACTTAMRGRRSSAPIAGPRWSRCAQRVAEELFPVVVRRRQRGHRAHRRRARRKRRVPRRHHPAGTEHDAAGAGRRTRLRSRCRRGVITISRSTRPTRLYSGVVQALCGAIEQMRQRLGGDEAQPRVILSGRRGGRDRAAPYRAGGGRG